MISNVHDGKKFIDKAILIHGNKYDYSKVQYVNTQTKVEIICNSCNPKRSFFQCPYAHLTKFGCNICGKKIKTTEQFIEDAIKVHGNKYDYSKVIYTGYRNKIEIICKQCQPQHSFFKIHKII
jgi:hypothetical protein